MGTSTLVGLPAFCQPGTNTSLPYRSITVQAYREVQGSVTGKEQVGDDAIGDESSVQGELQPPPDDLALASFDDLSDESALRLG